MKNIEDATQGLRQLRDVVGVGEDAYVLEKLSGIIVFLERYTGAIPMTLNRYITFLCIYTAAEVVASWLFFFLGSLGNAPAWNTAAAIISWIATTILLIGLSVAGFHGYENYKYGRN